MQAHEESQASIAVLEAKNLVLCAQQERNSKTSAKLGRKRAKGDTRVLTKDRIISRKDAERELVAKGKPKSRNTQGTDQEEEEVAPPAVAVADRDEAFDDGDDDDLMPLNTPSPPPMHTFLDELDDDEPLSAISDDDPGGFGFFDTVPIASSSRIKH